MPVLAEPNDPPNGRLQWQLSWKVNISSLKGPASISLRIRAENGAAPALRRLCTSCTTTASGKTALTASQASRVANGDAVVVVRARSATLRGAVKVSAHVLN